MQLLVKGREAREICGYCRRPKESGEFARPRNRLQRNWICFDCCSDVFREAMRKQDLQVKAKVKPTMRYVEIPGDFLPFASDRWIWELREAIRASDPKAAQQFNRARARA